MKDKGKTLGVVLLFLTNPLFIHILLTNISESNNIPFSPLIIIWLVFFVTWMFLLAIFTSNVWKKKRKIEITEILPQLKKKIQDWKKEGYKVDELEKMVEGRKK